MRKEKLLASSILIREDKKLAYREIQGNMVILNLPSGELYSLNKVGSLIWKQIDGKNKLADIANAIKDACEIPEDCSVEKDLIEFVQLLLQKELIKTLQ